MESVTISLDHYLELVRLQIKLEELQHRLNREYVSKDQILSELGLLENYTYEVINKVDRIREKEANGQ